MLTWTQSIQSSFSTTGRCTSLYRAVVAASRFVLQHMWVGQSANNQYISVLARISMHDWTVGDKKRCTFRLWEGFFVKASDKHMHGILKPQLCALIKWENNCYALWWKADNIWFSPYWILSLAFFISSLMHFKELSSSQPCSFFEKINLENSSYAYI
jgi:hypothetical protein